MNNPLTDSTQDPSASAAQTLWNSLYAKGVVNAPELPQSHETPRYIALMQAFAAWIAAWFLLGFMASLFDSVWGRFEGGAALFIGCIYLGLGLALYWGGRQQHFLQQFAFASCLSGTLALAWGLFDLLGDTFNLVWYLSMAALFLLLWGMIKHKVAQWVFAFCLLACLTGLLAEWHLLNLTPTLLVSLLSVVLLNIHRTGYHYQRARMLVYGAASLLLSIQLIHVFSMDRIFKALFISGWQSGMAVSHLLVVFTLCGFLLVSLFNQWQISLTAPSGLFAFLGLVLITALSLPMQGLSTAVWFILLGHYANESWLRGMGIASGLVFAGGYYYSLETTLMLKSLYLMGLGLLLLAARLVMWRYFPISDAQAELEEHV
ncbi:DUF4401 domain-containing protein [Shewanella xiamenensis]|uniref:DUF4401 domain-containing protein n=1 Tax=Shewanella xiamenensis TaxID=332186 RepID=UPI00217DC29C|nr:DUF4401 domain-containing protein [Shewanella xiamenensis]MCT8870526.1 DUF4401 domain-containing protein [Shewanella xiamenensis]UWH40674.1 DUF4401 domain-containing protein [Shewanella xiamenensis]